MIKMIIKKCILFLIKRGIFIQIYMKKILDNGNFIFLKILYFFILFHFSIVPIILKYRFFFFILIREITQTVSNRIRYGPIKSFFSHFDSLSHNFFFPSFLFVFFSFLRLYISSFYHSFYFDEILFKINSLFLIFQFFLKYYYILIYIFFKIETILFKYSKNILHIILSAYYTYKTLKPYK